MVDARTHGKEPCEAVCVADELQLGSSRALGTLSDAVSGLIEHTPRCIGDRNALTRRHFRPSEEHELLAWFAHFLTVRSGLWEVVEESARPLAMNTSRIVNTFEWRCFILAYSAACLVVRLDRFLVEESATHTLVQRKLNEGSPEHRIPRKQFTAVFESFTDPQKALLIQEAMVFAERHRDVIDQMASDHIVGPHVEKLALRETVLNPSRRRYWTRLLRFLSHAWRRRGASGAQQTIFAAMETGGRFVSELHDQWTPPLVDADLRHQIGEMLRPGDVIVTRHEWALTNLFLPGYWPHAALYVGFEEDRNRLSIEIDEARRIRWTDDRCVLEALKDGVLFRPLASTLAVDAVAVIRPKLSVREIAEALSRVSAHEGKGYNFDFDFFRSDRLVCTEVVYRAFDGLGTISIPLRERAGRPTLSAEDLLEMAVAGNTFEPVAICGAMNCPDRLVVGAEAGELIAQTLSPS